MIKKERYVISSTHVDSQGVRMAKSALESALPQLNGKRKVRLGLEHIRTFPPFGVMMNGEIFQGEDEHFYLAAESVYFDKQELFKLEDGTKLIKEYFSEGIHPFVECEEDEVDKLEISTDPANFEGDQDISEVNRIVAEQSGLEFTQSKFGRKSALSDPETIVTITKSLAIILGIIKSKLPEKISEAIGDDLAKFYKLISTLAIETIKRVKPANRPKNFVIEYPNAECIIELVITTHKADRVLNSLTIEKLAIITSKTEQLKNLNPEKIQFIYNDDDNWEFNYLLSSDGSAIGTIKAFNKRNMLYNQILKAQNEREEKQ
ncbi:hypothetical protein HGH93_31210 [Chitinophaga polysaccharea]|uniref:hypothetical protein n=1 Tax=Chitinophaga TaxID=79328 RepID=UPI0014555B68|nr:MULTISPECIES: hypothetical protein [Chitinophaga]NLR62601.1 hypothetical protein [Chitinophaga polysaccharea]NLU91465.1 hypothetical protein [Chitinophaga sp. Ak27]